MKHITNLILFIFISLTLPHLSLSCSVGPGYQFATNQEQITLASTVVFGRVDQVDYTIPNNEAIITLGPYRVWKSWHLRRSRKPRKLQISGFRSTAACGSGIPQVGDEVVLFLCPNRDRKTWLNARSRAWRKRYWSLNNIAVFTGMKYVKRGTKEYRDLRRLTRRLARSTRRSRCGKRVDSLPVGPIGPPPSLPGPNIPADEFDFPRDPDDE